MELTVSQIKSLAPDAASFSAGEKISHQDWASAGQSDRALWGEIYGSGSKPYQVRVDLREFAFRCSCPSRKLPCKHVLGLMLRVASDEKSVPKAQEPAWIVEWLDQRDERAQKKKEKSENDAEVIPSSTEGSAKVDQQKKRASQRFDRVKSGLEQYRLWLNDLLRAGLADLESRPGSFWSDEIKRLVDAQITPLASQVRVMQELAGTSHHATEKLLIQMGKSALLCEAFDHLEQLPSDLQSEVTQLFGWTVNQKELEAGGKQIEDRWIMLGQTAETELNVNTQYNWYWGVQSKRFLLLLQFAFGRNGFEEIHLPGSQLFGKAVFWPGTEKLRGRFLTKEQVFDELGQPARRSFLPDDAALIIPDFLNSIADQTVRQPWRTMFPALLRRIVVRPPIDENSEDDCKRNWRILDGSGNTLLLKGQNYWPLTALSAVGPITLFGLWDGWQFQPLSVWRGGFLETVMSENLTSEKYSTRSVSHLFDPPIIAGSDQNGKISPSFLKRALLGIDKTESLAIKTDNEFGITLLGDLLQKIKARSDASSWKFLLEAGMLSLAHQVGFIPPKSNPQKSVFFCARDPRRSLPKPLADVLMQLLEQQIRYGNENLSKKVISRLLRETAQLEMRLPDEKIPQFLSCFSRASLFREEANATVQFLLGTTGQWLEKFGQEWQELARTPIRQAEKTASDDLSPNINSNINPDINPNINPNVNPNINNEGRSFNNPAMTELAAPAKDFESINNKESESINNANSESISNEESVENSEQLELWTEGTFGQRKEVLLDLRHRVPDRGRALLDQTWKDEKVDHREAFLTILAENLSSRDIPFLEKAYSDRSSAVRTAAIDLLLKLPESLLTKRMIAQGELILTGGALQSGPLTSADGLSNFEVTPPPELTKEMKKDGLDQKPPKGIGKQGWLLFQIISRVAPSHWEIFFNRSPENILAIYRNDVYFSDLFCAWCRALKTFGGSVEWFHALWDISQKEGANLVKPSILKGIESDLVQFAVIKAPRLLKIIIKDIQENASTSSELLDLIWSVLIERESFPWSESFTEVFYKFLFKSRMPDAFILKYLPLFPQTLRLRVSQIVFQPNNLFHCTKAAQEKIRNTIALCRNFDQMIDKIQLNRQPPH